MGIFKRRIENVYAARATQLMPPASNPPISITSPWAPQDSLVTFAVDEALGGLLSEYQLMTRDTALRIPGVKRSHGLHVTQFAQIPWYLMDDAVRVGQQPGWLTNSASGVSPYHRWFGVGSDLFFYGWALLGFTADMTDCLHIPYGLWSVDPDTGDIRIDPTKVPARYHARPVAIPLGYGENGLLTDGIDTLKEARKIEQAYMNRLDNPVPLTILGIPRDDWAGMTAVERAQYRDQWVEGRQKSATALKVAEWPVDMPGQVPVDLYESGRNAVRLDIANHTSTPAGLLEGTRQGGSGTDITYTGVQDGATRSELWDFGLAKRMMLALEARLSLDDVCATGLSIRGDISNMIATPTPSTNPTSED